MESEKLLPCPNPWCDCPDELAVEPIVGTGAYGVECGCGFNGPALGTPELAIAAWNTRAPAELTGWQPIETAPKDGTLILVSFGAKGVRAVSWDDPFSDDWPVDPENGLWCVNDDKHGPYGLRGYSDDGYNSPTHWQPLPAPPGTTRAPADLRSALEAETIERCAKVAEDFKGSAALERCDDPTGATACEIADLIRNLAPTKGDVS